MALDKARKIMAGHDTVATLAKAYSLTTAKTRDIIKAAGADLIRADGHRGKLAMVESGKGKTKVVGWEDGQVGVDYDTTRVTKAAIHAVGVWTLEQLDVEVAAA